MRNGDTITVTYQARATSHGNGQEIVNNASIHANNAADQDDPAEVWINSAALDITKEVDRYEGYVGSLDIDPGFFEYTVTLKNAKRGTIANDVVISDDSLPKEMPVGRNNDGALRVEVKEKHPFDGPLVLRVEGNERTIGSTVAHQVFVQTESHTERVAAHADERELA